MSIKNLSSASSSSIATSSAASVSATTFVTSSSRSCERNPRSSELVWTDASADSSILARVASAASQESSSLVLTASVSEEQTAFSISSLRISNGKSSNKAASDSQRVTLLLSGLFNSSLDPEVACWRLELEASRALLTRSERMVAMTPSWLGSSRFSFSGIASTSTTFSRRRLMT